MIEWDLFQGYKDGSICKNQSMSYATLTKDKNQMIVSIDAEQT